MIRREMPSPKEYDLEASEYAGKEPKYENQSLMLTAAGKKVVIMDYLKDEGLYVVMNIDKPGMRSPAYKVSPDKLRKIEGDEK